MDSVRRPRWMWLVYNQNPFYLISAAVILFAIQPVGMSNSPADAIRSPWLLSGILLGYTTLLSITAFAIIRIGKVWDDARSILMVILLMLFAISVSFDRLCIQNPGLAVVILGLGAIFSLLVVESILLGTGIRLGWRFRVPMHVMIGLSFVFPLLFAASKYYRFSWDFRFLILMFPVAVGMSVLCLLPAVRRGADYVRDNGTPWVWPLFPHSVFVLLVFGLVGRTVLLTLAFDTSIGVETIFGWYLVTPIVLAIVFVLFEISIKEQQHWLSNLSMWLATVPFLICAMESRNHLQRELFADLADIIGDPIWMVTLATAAFYAIAMIRSAPAAEGWLVACLILLFGYAQFGQLEPAWYQISCWPLVAIATLQLGTVERRRASVRWFLAAIVLVPLTAQGGGETWGILIANDIYLSAVLIAIIFRDRFARQAGSVVAMTSIPWLLCHVFGGSFFDLSLVFICILGLLQALSSYAIWLMDRRRVHLYSASCLLLLLPWLLLLNSDVGLAVPQRVVWLSAVSLIFLGIGAFVSTLKAGLSTWLVPEFNRVVAEWWEPFWRESEVAMKGQLGISQKNLI